jgi:hypothetical protein
MAPPKHRILPNVMRHTQAIYKKFIKGFLQALYIVIWKYSVCQSLVPRVSIIKNTFLVVIFRIICRKRPLLSAHIFGFGQNIRDLPVSAAFSFIGGSIMNAHLESIFDRMRNSIPKWRKSWHLFEIKKGRTKGVIHYKYSRHTYSVINPYSGKPQDF